MKDKELPKLLVNKTEASEKIRNQINKGKELYNVQISSEQELTNLRHARKKWVDYNQTLCKSLFDNSPLSTWHGYEISFARILNDTLFTQNVEALKKVIESAINELESICEQLDLYKETKPIREKLYHAKAKGITKIKGITKKHLLPALGAIITSIIAGIILYLYRVLKTAIP